MNDYELRQFRNLESEQARLTAEREALKAENERLRAACERLEGKLSDRQDLIEEAEEHLADIRMYERDRAIAECDAWKAKLDAQLALHEQGRAENERLRAEVAEWQQSATEAACWQDLREEQLTELRGAVEVLEKTMREGATTQGNGWSSDERRSASFWAGKLDAVLAKVTP